MKRCVIFCAGPLGKADYQPAAGDVVLCADGGWHHAAALGVRPDLLLGDMDSISDLPQDIPMRRLPPEKDDTDTMLAIREGLARGCDDFLLLGALGGRLDHTFANLQALCFAAAEGATAEAQGQGQTARLLLPGHHRIPRKEGVYLSLFALSDRVEGITLRGVKYKVENFTLSRSLPMGVSNEFAAAEAEISFAAGQMLMILSPREGA